ncbi:unnamed protein product, partial [Heligmosomoides polygyrus]|uniref:DUF4378 domain-containing protein n=1 Tax=Heligmosomoides polygyrus TaxID=6339 RepID=A0A183GS01_HELPZ
NAIAEVEVELHTEREVGTSCGGIGVARRKDDRRQPSVAGGVLAAVLQRVQRIVAAEIRPQRRSQIERAVLEEGGVEVAGMFGEESRQRNQSRKSRVDRRRQESAGGDRATTLVSTGRRRLLAHSTHTSGLSAAIDLPPPMANLFSRKCLRMLKKRRRRTTRFSRPTDCYIWEEEELQLLFTETMALRGVIDEQCTSLCAW